MGAPTDQAVIAKIKAIYGLRLKERDYEIMLKMKSVSDIALFLKQHPLYRDILRPINENDLHRNQLEELIRKNTFRTSLKLIQFAYMKDQAFYDLSYIKHEIDLILGQFRDIISETTDQSVSDAPLYLRKHIRFDILKLAKADTYAKVLDVLQGTDYYDHIKKFYREKREDIRYADIEKELEIYFYDTIFARIDQTYSGKLAADLKDIYLTKIELDNIIKIYRLKKFYNTPPDLIKDALIWKYSKIKEKEMDELVSIRFAEDLLPYLDKTHSLQKRTDKENYVFVEYFAKRISYNLAKKYLYYSSELPKVYTSFLALLDIETENLTHIIEGIRYELNDSEIRRMLIY